MWLQSKSAERAFGMNMEEKDKKGNPVKFHYDIGTTPVQVRDDHGEIALKLWSEHVVAVPDPAKAKLPYNPEGKLEIGAPPAGDSEYLANSYMCTKCKKRHMNSSRTGVKHLEFKE